MIAHAKELSLVLENSELWCPATQNPCARPSFFWNAGCLAWI